MSRRRSILGEDRLLRIAGPAPVDRPGELGGVAEHPRTVIVLVPHHDELRLAPQRVERPPGVSIRDVGPQPVGERAHLAGEVVERRVPARPHQAEDGVAEPQRHDPAARVDHPRIALEPPLERRAHHLRQHRPPEAQRALGRRPGEHDRRLLDRSRDRAGREVQRAARGRRCPRRHRHHRSELRAEPGHERRPYRDRVEPTGHGERPARAAVVGTCPGPEVGQAQRNDVRTAKPRHERMRLRVQGLVDARQQHRLDGDPALLVLVRDDSHDPIDVVLVHPGQRLREPRELQRQRLLPRRRRALQAVHRVIDPGGRVERAAEAANHVPGPRAVGVPRVEPQVLHHVGGALLADRVVDPSGLDHRCHRHRGRRRVRRQRHAEPVGELERLRRDSRARKQ